MQCISVKNYLVPKTKIRAYKVSLHLCYVQGVLTPAVIFNRDGSVVRGVTEKDNFFFLSEVAESFSKCSLHSDDCMLRMLIVYLIMCFD